jgi:hypothetical protein
MPAKSEKTAEQRRLIEAKLAELRQVDERLEGKNPAERKAAMQAKHDELKAWAEQNDIPLDRLQAPRHGGARAA